VVGVILYMSINEFMKSYHRYILYIPVSIILLSFLFLCLPINGFALQDENLSEWTRIGGSRSSGIEASERREDPKKPWMEHEKSRDQMISEAMKRQKSLYECQRIEKKASEPEVKKKEELIDQAEVNEESRMYRKLSEWNRIGPERSTMPEMPQRPKRKVEEKKPPTIAQRLEALDLSEGLSGVFEDRRFTDISQRINKRKGWKR